MLLSLCFLEHDGVLERTIPWFSLMPLFISLDRHRRNLKWRLLHCFFFGAILCCWPLLSAGAFELPTISGAVWASLPMIGTWMLFCAAGGFLLQRPSRLAVVPGLAVAWSGIEYLRVECIPLGTSWMQLGQALKPEHPEGQLAAALGLAGLGFTICLVNGAFFLALRERQGRVQLYSALAGALGVISLLVLGSLTGAPADHPDRPAHEALRIGIVQTDKGGPADHLELARQLLNSRPQLIFFPGDAFVATPGQPGLKTGLSTLAREEEVALVAGLVPEQGRNGALVYIAGGGRHEDTARGETLVIETKQEQSILAVSDRVSQSAYRMARLAANGAQLYLVAGDGTQSGVENELLRNRLLAFRAVETGTYICRATSAGSSSIIDQLGVTLAEAPRNQAWASVTSVPFIDPVHDRTWFVRGGWLIGPACLLALGLLAFLLSLSLWKGPVGSRGGRPQDNTSPS